VLKGERDDGMGGEGRKGGVGQGHDEERNLFVRDSRSCLDRILQAPCTLQPSPSLLAPRSNRCLLKGLPGWWRV
jgi:hypothetical protein